MILKIVVAVPLAAILQASLAQGSIPITFPQKAHRQVWIGASEYDVPGQDLVASAGGSVSVGDASTPDSHYVHVWDVDRNALATRKVSVARKGWKVVDPEFAHHYQLQVRCEYQGKPVAAATIDLTAGNVTQSKLLSPDRNGVATFYAVKAGRMTLQARYNVGEEMKVSPLVTYVLGPFDPIARKPLVLAITDPVAVVEPTTNPSNGAKKAETAPSQTPPPSTGGNVVVYLVGLGLAGLLIYGILAYTRKNADLLNAKLEKVGVQIPADPTDEPEPDVVPAGPVSPPAPAQIILGDGAASVTPAAPAVGAALNPRLVKDGMPWLVPNGTMTIGREGEAALGLETESTVSRKHAEVTRSGDSVVVTDLGSTNGTFVNGQRITGSQELRHGDTVQFGAIQFRFET